MSALQKENPHRPLAKAKPKLRQNVLREKLKKQRQELANDVIALESNIVTKAARELDDQRAAASEMAQARRSSDAAVGTCFVAGVRNDDDRVVRRAFFDEEKRAHKQGKRGVGAPQLRSLLEIIDGRRADLRRDFWDVERTGDADLRRLRFHHRGVMEGSLACAALSEVLGTPTRRVRRCPTVFRGLKERCACSHARCAASIRVACLQEISDGARRRSAV